MKQLKLKLATLPIEFLPFVLGMAILSMFFIYWLSGMQS